MGRGPSSPCRFARRACRAFARREAQRCPVPCSQLQANRQPQRLAWGASADGSVRGPQAPSRRPAIMARLAGHSGVRTRISPWSTPSIAQNPAEVGAVRDGRSRLAGRSRSQPSGGSQPSAGGNGRDLPGGLESSPWGLAPGFAAAAGRGAIAGIRPGRAAPSGVLLHPPPRRWRQCQAMARAAACRRSKPTRPFACTAKNIPAKIAEKPALVGAESSRLG